MKVLAKLALSAGVVLGAIGLAGPAEAAPSGNYYFKNNASKGVTRVANSFGGTSTFSTSIASGGTGTGSVASSGSNTYSGTTIWQDAQGVNGCSFTVAISYNTGTQKYLFSFSSSTYGSGSTATCSQTYSTNTSTGVFTAYPVIGGF